MTSFCYQCDGKMRKKKWIINFAKCEKIGGKIHKKTRVVKSVK